MEEKLNYTSYLEWEFLEYPLNISEIKFEKNNWGFQKDINIEIKRTSNLRLEVVIKGCIDDFQNLDGNDYIGKGNIVKGQIIEGADGKGRSVKLYGCLLEEYKTDTFKYKYIEGVLNIDSVIIRDCERRVSNNLYRYEWFVLNGFPSNAHFWGSTLRNPKLDNKKIHIGIDNFDDIAENYSGATISKDYTSIKCLGTEIIISKVPAKSLPFSKYSGICLEIRNNNNIIQTS